MDLDESLESGNLPREHFQILKITLGLILFISAANLFNDLRAYTFMPDIKGVVAESFTRGIRGTDHYIRLEMGKEIEVPVRVENRCNQGSNVDYKQGSFIAKIDGNKKVYFCLTPILVLLLLSDF